MKKVVFFILPFILLSIVGKSQDDFIMNLAIKTPYASVIYANNVGEMTTTGANNRGETSAMWTRTLGSGTKICLY